ncbi:retinol dehydrogenase 13-like isoform X2 [Euwallacea similis]|uniref:retinol dehydrogenase 13-like isoform X2 n=1 Tax=Euwallacea similis TaxID=1736056 RepID=UPI00344D37CB
MTILLFLILSPIGIIFIVNKLILCFRCNSKVFLAGKTALITGGTAADFVDTSKAVQEIIKKTHNPDVIGKPLDLASFQSVRNFVKDIYLTEDKLNIVINNAGTAYLDSSYTEDGLHRTMQVNHFGHFLMTYLLIDLLKKSAPSRIIFTSSILAYFVSARFMYEFNPKKTICQGNLFKIYPTTKLYAAAISKTFAKKLEGTGITCNAYNPGGTRTQIFFKQFRNIWDIFPTVLGFFVWTYGKTPEESAQTPIYLAQADEIESVTGKFFTEGRTFLAPIPTTNVKFCDKLWEKSIIYSKLADNEITI